MPNPAHQSDKNPTPRWLAVAVILWAGFIGAVFMTPVAIWATSNGDGGLSLFTRLFIASWLVCCVPAAVSWLLAPQPRAPKDQHG